MLAQYVRFGDAPNTSGYPGQVMTLFSCLFAALWLSSISVFHTRSPRIIGAGIDEYRRIASASFWTFGIIAMVTLLAKIDLARGYLAVALPFGTIGLLASRNMWRKYVCRKRRAQGKYQTMVLAHRRPAGVSHLARGTDPQSQRRLRRGRCRHPGIRAFPWQDAHDQAARRSRSSVTKRRASPLLSSCGADTVAVTRTEHFGVQGIRELMWQLETMDVDLVVAPGVMDVAGARDWRCGPFAGFPLLHVEKPQYEGTQRFQKRAFDFCFSLAALIATVATSHRIRHRDQSSPAKGRSSTEPNASAWTASPSRCSSSGRWSTAPTRRSTACCR